MKYYSRKRIVLSILVSVVLLIIVAIAIEDSNTYSRNKDTINPFVGGLLAGVPLLAVLLPKIWWNFRS